MIKQDQFLGLRYRKDYLCKYKKKTILEKSKPMTYQLGFKQARRTTRLIKNQGFIIELN